MGESHTHGTERGGGPRLAGWIDAARRRIEATGRRPGYRLGLVGAGFLITGIVLLGGAAVLPVASSETTTSTAGVEFVTEAERLAPKTGSFSICPDCHSFLDPPAAERPLLTKDFGHEKHLTRGAVCNNCHPVPVHTEQGTRRPGMADCYGCHGQGADAIAPGTCALCHPPDMPLAPASHTAPFYAGGHAEVVATGGTRECFVCHEGDEQTFCTNCHGVMLPHPTGWAVTAGDDPGDHVDWAYQDAAVCVRCHDNTQKPAPPGCYTGECHGS